MEFTVIDTTKGNACIIYNDFKFRKYRVLRSDEISWRCCVRVCKAYLKTDILVSGILESWNEHNHEAESEKNLQLETFRSACKRKSQEDISLRPGKIIRRALLSKPTSSSELSSMDLIAVKKAMYRVRRKSLPLIPKTREQAIKQVSEIPVTTSKEENFAFVFEDDEIVVITCLTNLKVLCDLVTDVFADGTFCFAPRHFAQLYTIHGYNNGLYLPLVFCFLPSKTKDCYLRLWQILRKLCHDNSLELLPRVMHLDLEIVAMDAVASTFPECKIKACRFHLGQAFYRKLKSIAKLGNEYMNLDSEVGKWLKLFFGLALLPSEEVPEAFCDIFGIAPNNGGAVTFSDYVLENYVGETAKYPPELWAEKPSKSPHTTNGPESFHSNFNAQFYSPHPTIFAVINVLKETQAETYVKIEDLKRNRRVPVRKQEKLRLKFLEETWNEYETGAISRLQYVKKMGLRFQAQKV